MDSRLPKFLLVGVLNTVFGYSLFAFFIFVGLHYSLAVLLSTVLGILFNFKTIGRLVFRSHNNRLIFRFVATYGLTYLLNVVFLRILDGLRVNMYIAGMLLLIPLALISFVLQKKYVFTEKAG
ncbi:MAG TPA: GtrA family protein [Geobacteraceae bacterium]